MLCVSNMQGNVDTISQHIVSQWSKEMPVMEKALNAKRFSIILLIHSLLEHLEKQR